MLDSFTEVLNCDCWSIGTDHQAMARETARLVSGANLDGLRWEEHKLFAAVPVFISRKQIGQLERTVHAVERVVRTPAYQAQVLAEAPSTARHPTEAGGVFMGYDFHLTPEGPALIEVNTNAGGALLNLLLARAQRTSCDEARSLAIGPLELDALEDVFVEAFRSEWQRSRGNVPLRTIAIVDDEPQAQFLYPEFLLFRELFRRSGFEATIVAPEELRFDGGALYVGAMPIDLVYNRLVDFYLEQPSHRALRDSYLANAVVLTPHPRAHALYADKGNLVHFGDSAFLTDIGIDPATVAILNTSVPETRRVTQNQADEFWRGRRQWFFKPVHGYGSKAAYRGDKLTRSTFDHVLRGNYVAQRVVHPSRRHVQAEGQLVPLKVDVRAFVCDGKVLLFAARLYDGQTTNFRTPGGGFAPVLTEARAVALPGRSAPP